jgi:hypothetical protein
MTTHPVRLHVVAAERMERVHVLVRLALLVALGALGWSSVYWVLYLTLPALAAILISSKGSARYLTEDGPTMVRVLKWLAAAYGYLWLLTDSFPTEEPSRTVELQIETGGAPTMSSALVRLVSSLPAILILALLSVAAALLWLVGAVVILVRQKLPAVIAHFLALTLRFQFRLAAYHLSLVARYPSFEEAPLVHVPDSGAV